jgi:predicted ribonuclease toxin of YeeF-YezG toxin-antitoxin module
MAATGAKWGKRAVDSADAFADATRNAPSYPTNTYARPSGFRAGVRPQAWNNAIEPSTGRVRDDLTGRFMSPDKPWDMGHQPGYEFRKHAADAEARGISRQQFLDEHNDPTHYRPELPSSNRSHRAEDTSDDFAGP